MAYQIHSAENLSFSTISTINNYIFTLLVSEQTQKRGTMIASLSTRPVQIAIGSRKPSVGSPSVRCQSQVGDKVLPMLRGPADILFLGPRLALGALLTANQNLERL